MNKLLLLLLSILISFNSYGDSSDETICVTTDAQYIDGIFYFPNETKPFTGKNLCKYENGQKYSEANFKDGKADGKLIWWYENGQQRGEGNYKDDKLHGKFSLWNENGQLIFETTYEDGECISVDCFD